MANTLPPKWIAVHKDHKRFREICKIFLKIHLFKTESVVTKKKENETQAINSTKNKRLRLVFTLKTSKKNCATEKKFISSADEQKYKIL